MNFGRILSQFNRKIVEIEAQGDKELGIQIGWTLSSLWVWVESSHQIRG